MNVSQPGEQETRCYPCIRMQKDPAGGWAFTAELRVGDRVPANGPKRDAHGSESAAVTELVARLRRLPQLVQHFEIIVRGQPYRDVEAAAAVLLADPPRCD